LGNSLILKSVSELSISRVNAVISCTLQREVASVLLRFKYLKLLEVRMIPLLSGVKGMNSKTYKIAFLTAIS
jgi:hypothetical protein